MRAESEPVPVTGFLPNFSPIPPYRAGLKTRDTSVGMKFTPRVKTTTTTRCPVMALVLANLTNAIVGTPLTQVRESRSTRWMLLMIVRSSEISCHLRQPPPAWAQGIDGSNPVAPTTFTRVYSGQISDSSFRADRYNFLPNVFSILRPGWSRRRNTTCPTSQKRSPTCITVTF